MQHFSCKTQIYTGPGCVKELSRLESKRLLLVTDPYFVKSGTAEQILRLSGAAQTKLFDKVQPDPSVSLAAEGTAVVREFQPDTVVALGGGSTMDCAKAMVYFAGDKVCLAAIPTTSGSGSEVTDFAILTHAGTKHPLVDPKLCPDAAFLDSDLLKGLPKTLVADTGFDVLCHALEALVAKGASAVTDALAKEAFRITFSKLPASYGGNTDVRGSIHQASTMAGMAFTQAGLGLCHAMAHSLGGLFHIPHGRLNAILLPAVLECNAHICPEKYASIARQTGLPGAADSVAVRNLKNGLIRLRREMQMPQTLKEAGIDPRKVRFSADKIVKDTLADPCCDSNPLPVEDFMVRKILEEVTGRG